MYRSILFALLSLVCVNATAFSQSATPINAQHVHRLLNAASSSVARAPALRNDNGYLDRLAQLRFLWGLPPRGVEWQIDADSVNRLLDAGLIDEARRMLGALHAPADDKYYRLVERMGEQLIHAGRIYEALTFGDSTDIAHSLVGLVTLTTGETTRLANIAVMKRILRDGVANELSLYTLREGVLHLMSIPELRVEFAKSDSARLPVLKALLLRKAALGDSLLAVMHRDIRRMPTEAERQRMLSKLGEYCNLARSDACARRGIPAPRVGDENNNLRFEIARAMAAERFVVVDALLDSLRSVSPPPYIAHIAWLTAAIEARPRCDRLQCARLDAWLLERLPLAERAIAGAPQPHADSLRMYVADVTAGRDTDRALRLAAEIRDPLVRNWAHARIGLRIVDFDVDLARKLLLTKPLYGFMPRSTVDSAFVKIAAAERMAGDTAKARETLSNVQDKSHVMRADLQWAVVQKNNGQWERGRDFAINALEWWDPSAEPNGADLYFSWYYELELGHYLVHWALLIDDPVDRGIAAVAIVESVSRERRAVFKHAIPGAVHGLNVP